MDPRKLRRARDIVLAEATEAGVAATEEDCVKNVMFDSRIDPTKVRRFDKQTGKFYPRIETQDHYTQMVQGGFWYISPSQARKEPQVQ